MKVAFQPLQKRRLKNSTPPIKRVTGQPDQLRSAKPLSPHVVQLDLELFDVDDVGHPYRGVPIEQRKLDMRLGEMLPDKLQHQQFVKVRVEQRPDYRIKFPVVVMRAFCKVDNHGGERSSQTV